MNHPLETWMIHLRILIFSKFSLLHQIKAFFRSTKYFFLLYLFICFMAAPKAYGRSQARD